MSSREIDKRFFLIILIAVIFLTPMNVLAEEELFLDIEKVIKMSLESSEDYKIKKNEIVKSQSKCKEAKADRYPHVDSTITWRNNFEYPNNPLLLIDDYQGEAGIRLTQLLHSFGRVSNAIKAEKRGVNISRLDKNRIVLDIIFSAKVSYYAAILAQRSLVILEESLKNSEKSKEMLKNASSLGRISKKDNIKMSADISSRKPMVNNAKIAHDSTMKSLKNMIGIDENVAISLTDTLGNCYELIESGIYFESFENNEPLIKALEERVRMTEDIVRIKRAEFMPVVSLFGAWTSAGASKEEHIGNHFDDYGVAGISVSFPIFDGGETKERLSQARADVRSTELALKKTKKDLRLALSTAISEYYQYVETLEADVESVKLARDSFSMHQDLLMSGKITLTEINDAELLLTRMMLNKEVTLFNLKKTMALVERLSASEEER